MSKIATLPKNYSAEHIFTMYAERLVADNPGWYTRVHKSHNKGHVFNEKRELVITYKKFKNILSELNKEFGKALINGYTVDLLNSLGCLYVARIKRNANIARINHVASSKRKKELIAKGEDISDVSKWKIYYTDDEYIRLKHFRPNTKNKQYHGLQFYRFMPAKGANGLRRKISTAVNTRQVSIAIYPLIQPTNVNI